jgi:hypothetical protein
VLRGQQTFALVKTQSPQGDSGLMGKFPQWQNYPTRSTARGAGAGVGSIHTAGGHERDIRCPCRAYAATRVNLNLATYGSDGIRVFCPENITSRWQPDIVPHHPLPGNATFEASRKWSAFEKR